MSKGRPKAEPVRVWSTTPRDGSSRLTEIRGDRGDPACVWLLLDGVKAGLVARETVARLGLTPMSAWTEATALALDAEVRGRLSDRAARRLLSVRVRSRAELVQALTRRGHARADADRSAETYARLGLVDDARFAEIAVRSELARRPVGRRLLEAKLRGKGVADAPARAAVDAAMEDRDPAADALRAARGAARTLPSSLDDAAARRRLAGRLLRRGFDGEVVRRAVDLALRERRGGG